MVVKGKLEGEESSKRIYRMGLSNEANILISNIATLQSFNILKII
jgi:hypothetical protein